MRISERASLHCKSWQCIKLLGYGIQYPSTTKIKPNSIELYLYTRDHTICIIAFSFQAQSVNVYRIYLSSIILKLKLFIERKPVRESDVQPPRVLTSILCNNSLQLCIYFENVKRYPDIPDAGKKSGQDIAVPQKQKNIKKCFLAGN